MTEMEQLDPHTEKRSRLAIKGQGGTSLFQMRRGQMAEGTARHGFDSKRETERRARRRVTFASSDQRERATTFRASARNRVKGDPSLFVCDNFAFSSEVVITKRHTQFGNDRYQEGVAAAIER